MVKCYGCNLEAKCVDFKEGVYDIYFCERCIRFFAIIKLVKNYRKRFEEKVPK